TKGAIFVRTLATDQTAFQAIITRRPDSPDSLKSDFTSSVANTSSKRFPSPCLVKETPLFDAPSRLRVYSTSYASRLLESVLDFFPCLAFVMGVPLLTRIAGDYIAANPPHHPNLAHLVDDFPA